MMAQKDGILYIAGGWMLYSPPYENQRGPNPVLRSLDVSKSFQTSLESTRYIRTEATLGEVPDVANGALFPTESGLDLTFGTRLPDNSTIYGKGDNTTGDKKWQYEIKTQRWTNKDIKLNNWFPANSLKTVSSSMTAWIPALKKGFLFGGILAFVNRTSSGLEEAEEHNGLITYDQATDTWTNETIPFRGIYGGGLVHITTDTDEVLIQLGGRSDWVSSIKPFSEIRIYSTKKSKWYTQRLPYGALVPTPRSLFCTALKSASDNSSYQIYIMGGVESDTLGATRGSTVDSVWVLSIPSFEWVQLRTIWEDAAANPRARISPKCEAIGEHYIFYYGGRNTLAEIGPVTCDKRANAAFLLDVNTLKWTDKFTPNEGKYEIPADVIRLIGGDKNGGSAKKAPANDWSNPDLETIMAINTTVSPRGPPKLNVRAIAGGTTGGVVAVVLGILGAMLYRHRQRSRIARKPGNPREPIDHNQANGGVIAAELPSRGVVREMDASHGNGQR